MKTAITLAAFTTIAVPAFAEAPINPVTGELPGEAEFEALASIEALEDGDVAHVDLTMLPQAFPSTLEKGGEWTTPVGCEFGMIEKIEAVSVATGSNHLLMSVWLGNRNDHAANGLSCEYSPTPGAEAPNDWAQIRLTGCYLVRSVSIPTARELVLNPLPASACGLHD